MYYLWVLRPMLSFWDTPCLEVQIKYLCIDPQGKSKKTG